MAYRTTERIASLGKISNDELQASLSRHEKWITSGGASGDPAILTGLDLRDADLSYRVLPSADFSGSDLSGANLCYADLRDSSFEDSILRTSDLRYSDLTETRGLISEQLAGCDLAGAKLPESIKDFEQLKSAAAVSEIAQRHFAGMVAVSAYCILTLATTRDARLFNNAGALQLPVIRVSLPIDLFFWCAPAVLICYFVYSHICMQRLWEAIIALPRRFPDGSNVFETTNRWMLNSLVRLALCNPETSAPKLIASQVAASIALGYWLLPFTVGLLAVRYFPRQEMIVTILHCMLFSLACGTALYMKTLASSTLGARNRTARSPIILGFAVTAGTLLFIASLPTVSAGWKHSPVHVSFREAELSTKPRNWDLLVQHADAIVTDPRKREEAMQILASAKGVRLNDLDLQWINAFAAFLANSDISKSNLSHGDLFKADFQGAILRDAYLNSAWLYAAHLNLSDLQGADLSESDARHADFRGSQIFQTNLQYADLREADFRGVTIAGDLEQSCLRGARLENADLSYSNLRNASLSGADLRKANFKSAVAINARLSNASLQGALFQDAILINADLRWANMEGADLSGAYLLNADLRGVRNLSKNELKKAFINSGTKCPDELVNDCKDLALKAQWGEIDEQQANEQKKDPCEKLSSEDSPKQTTRTTD